MNKSYCKDCGCLVEGDNGEWLCGSHSEDEIGTFDNCPEQSTASARADELYDEFVSNNRHLFNKTGSTEEEVADQIFDDFVCLNPDEDEEVYDLVYEHIFGGLT
jgi:hypothetical protein